LKVENELIEEIGAILGPLKKDIAPN